MMMQTWGLGSVLDDAKARAKGIQDGAQEVLDIAEGAKATGDAIGDIGDAVLKFMQFGADDIKSPMIGYNPDLTPKQMNTYSKKAFLAAVAAGYVFPDAEWAYMGFKPPVGSGKPGQIWDGVSGRWVGAGQAPTDTTTPPAQPTQLALTQSYINHTSGTLGRQLWDQSVAYAASQVVAGNYAEANKLGAYGKPGLTSLIRQVGLAVSRLATTMGMKITKGPRTGTLWATYNAARISQLVAIVSKMPKAARPANAGALGALATDAEVPTTKTKTKTGGGDGQGAGGGGVLALGALVWLAMRAMG